MRRTASIAIGLALSASLLGGGAAYADDRPPAPAPADGDSPGVIMVPKPGWPRLSGDTALDTMSAIVSCERGWGDDWRGTVVIATDEGWWDALSASSLAGKEGAPILLSHRDGVPEQTLAQLDRLAPSKVIVVGGELAVSEAAAGELAGRTGAELERVSGRDAAGTAVAVSQRLGSAGDEALVATASTFQDALSAAPYAYARGCPVLLVGPDGALSGEAVAAIGDRRVVIVGGEQAVPEAVRSQLGGRSVSRVGGADTVATSKLFAQRALACGSSRIGMGVATAAGWHDALTGAALCGRCGSVLLLATESDTSAVSEVAAKGWEEPGWEECDGWIFGGPDALSDRAMMATPKSGYAEAE